MFDGIKILDLSVSADALLTNARLLFPLAVDGQTGAVLDHRRKATDRGLTFTLTPTKAGLLRCELKGSIHRYGRGGLHNADHFTVNDLLLTLDELVTAYGINPFRSRLNNVEFGVNVVLPFPVAHLLYNLIMYKYRPFTKEPGDGFAYYQCLTQRYAVKLYDKGHQYGLGAHVLRVEVKVLKMEYLRSKGVRLNWLADLLTVGNYGTLGALLVEVFSEILFDEPTIDADRLTAKERDLYKDGRNPRFWSIPDDVSGKEYERSRKALQRAETSFRALLDQHRTGLNWQEQTAVLIGQTWERLMVIDDDLLTRIDNCLQRWRAVANCPKLTGLDEGVPERGTPEKCPKLTGCSDDPPTGEMSQINPLSIALIWDNGSSRADAPTDERGTPVQAMNQPPEQEVVLCPVTGIVIEQPRPGQRFVSAAMLRVLHDTDRARFDELAERFLKAKQAGTNLDKRCYHIAHNIRNTYTNPFNNPLRRIKKYQQVKEGETLLLFPIGPTIRPTDRLLTALEFRRGTPYEVRL